jgi:predicted nucleic acid-binding protein
VTYLLDVNVLLALRYEGHVHNSRAENWLNCQQASGAWASLATCAIAELGFVRVASGKAGFAENVRVAQEDLKRLKAKRVFTFLDDGLGADRLPSWVWKSKEVTDGHLLELARLCHARLITLDTGIPGALLIPEQPSGPLMVRESRVHYGNAA